MGVQRTIIHPHPRDNQLSPIPIDFDPETLGWILDEGGRGSHAPSCLSLPLVFKIKNECVDDGSPSVLGSKLPPCPPGRTFSSKLASCFQSV